MTYHQIKTSPRKYLTKYLWGKKCSKGLGGSTVAEGLPSTHEALDSSPSTGKACLLGTRVMAQQLKSTDCPSIAFQF